ncbi:MAG: 3-isopropylmalate dehydrogenase, partial [Chloroflexota bacterium]
MDFTLAVLPGDGIGPEVVAEGIRVLDAVGRASGHRFAYRYDDVGGCAIDKHGVALRPETLAMCRACDAVLFGAVGGPRWDDPKASVRPEDAILGLRKGLGLYANIRPVKVYPQLMDATPLKPDMLRGVDLVVIRELTGGLYFAKPKRRWRVKAGRKAIDSLAYTEQEVARILHVGFQMARLRRKKLTSVDKANVLESSRLWREIAMEMAKEYPDVHLDHLLVDSAA